MKKRAGRKDFPYSLMELSSLLLPPHTRKGPASWTAHAAAVSLGWAEMATLLCSF